MPLKDPISADEGQSTPHSEHHQASVAKPSTSSRDEKFHEETRDGVNILTVHPSSAPAGSLYNEMHTSADSADGGLLSHSNDAAGGMQHTNSIPFNDLFSQSHHRRALQGDEAARAMAAQSTATDPNRLGSPDNQASLTAGQKLKNLQKMRKNSLVPLRAHTPVKANPPTEDSKVFDRGRGRGDVFYLLYRAAL